MPIKNSARTCPAPSPLEEEGEEVDASEAFNSYIEYNKVLRTWFVAFGVGGPALFLVNEKIAHQLLETNSLRWVAACFLGGAVAQVVGAMINKFANWYVYMAAIRDRSNSTWRHKFAEWLIEQFWIDMVIDVSTIVVFGLAAWQMFTVFAKVGGA